MWERAETDLTNSKVELAGKAVRSFCFSSTMLLCLMHLEILVLQQFLEIHDFHDPLSFTLALHLSLLLQVSDVCIAIERTALHHLQVVLQFSNVLGALPKQLPGLQQLRRHVISLLRHFRQRRLQPLYDNALRKRSDAS